MNKGFADQAFRWLSRASGAAVLLIMLLVGGFLLYRAWLALRVAGWSFLTTQAWEPDSGRFGIAAVLPGTILIAIVAISVALHWPRPRHFTSPSTRSAASAGH